MWRQLANESGSQNICSKRDKIRASQQTYFLALAVLHTVTVRARASAPIHQIMPSVTRGCTSTTCDGAVNEVACDAAPHILKKGKKSLTNHASAISIRTQGRQSHRHFSLKNSAEKR